MWIDLLNPVWLIWLISMVASFALGNGYGQDKIRFKLRDMNLYKLVPDERDRGSVKDFEVYHSECGRTLEKL